jgi:hypothetical protein
VVDLQEVYYQIQQMGLHHLQIHHYLLQVKLLLSFLLDHLLLK